MDLGVSHVKHDGNAGYVTYQLCVCMCQSLDSHTTSSGISFFTWKIRMLMWTVPPDPWRGSGEVKQRTVGKVWRNSMLHMVTFLLPQKAFQELIRGLNIYWALKMQEHWVQRGLEVKTVSSMGSLWSRGSRPVYRKLNKSRPSGSWVRDSVLPVQKSRVRTHLAGKIFFLTLQERGASPQ